jgi:hypothetical protein
MEGTLPVQTRITQHELTQNDDQEQHQESTHRGTNGYEQLCATVCGIIVRRRNCKLKQPRWIEWLDLEKCKNEQVTNASNVEWAPRVIDSGDPRWRRKSISEKRKKKNFRNVNRNTRTSTDQRRERVLRIRSTCSWQLRKLLRLLQWQQCERIQIKLNLCSAGDATPRICCGCTSVFAHCGQCVGEVEKADPTHVVVFILLTCEPHQVQ